MSDLNIIHMSNDIHSTYGAVPMTNLNGQIREPPNNGKFYQNKVILLILNIQNSDN